MKSINICGHEILPGKSIDIDMPIVKLYTDTNISMPIHVRRARKDGPTFFVSAAVHGDEINGIEIIRRLLRLKTFKLSAGTLILAPMVNVYGVLNQ
ncbi:MAG: putative deacylase, partial [Arenicella sp.]